MLLSDSENRTDPSMTMPSALYCSFVETMKTECYTKSILELWDFDMEKISNLTKDDIVNAINTYDRKWVNDKSNWVVIWFTWYKF